MKKAIRTGRFGIDTLTPGGVRWITADIQTLEIGDDGQIKSTSFRDKKLYRKVKDVASQVVTITDPVTGQTFDISMAGIGVGITKGMINWMIEDNPGAYYDQETDRVILGDSDS